MLKDFNRHPFLPVSLTSFKLCRSESIIKKLRKFKETSLTLKKVRWLMLRWLTYIYFDSIILHGRSWLKEFNKHGTDISLQ